MKRELESTEREMPAHWHVIVHQCGDLLASVVWNPSDTGFYGAKAEAERRAAVRGLRSILTLDRTTYHTMLRDPRPWRALLPMLREFAQRHPLVSDEFAYMRGGDLLLLSTDLFERNTLYYAMMRPVFSQLAPLLRDADVLRETERFSASELEQHLACAATYLFRQFGRGGLSTDWRSDARNVHHPLFTSAEPISWLFEALLESLEGAVGPDATDDTRYALVPGLHAHGLPLRAGQFARDLSRELANFDGTGVSKVGRLGPPKYKPSATATELVAPLRSFVALWRRDGGTRERTHAELEARLRADIVRQAELLQEPDGAETLVPLAELPFAYKLFWLTLCRMTSGFATVDYDPALDDPQRRHRMFHSPAVLSQIRDLWQSRSAEPGHCITCCADGVVCHEASCPENAYCSPKCQYWLHTLNEL